MVDRAGRIAYIGSPIFLDLALAKVLAPNADAETVGGEMAEAVAAYVAACAHLEKREDPDGFLRAFAKFEADYPSLAGRLPACGQKLGLLRGRGKTAAKEYAKSLIAKAEDRHDVFMLEFVHVQCRGEMPALAVRAAEALVAIDGGANPWSLLRLAETHHANGEKREAADYARRATRAAADSPAADRLEVAVRVRKILSGK